MAGTVTTGRSALARTEKVSPTSSSSNSSTGSIRVSELISALSYALDLTEGRPMGHSVRACVIGMRIAEEIGLPAQVQADLYYTLLLKDAGCSSNSSRLYHILNADDIRAKGDLKTTDWTRVGWESLHYALTHVATGDAFPQRVWRLVRVAATQQRNSCELVKIRCERGSSIVRKLGFSAAVAAGIYSLDEHCRTPRSGLCGSAPELASLWDRASLLACRSVRTTTRTRCRRRTSSSRSQSSLV
jgi:hypothetical protein